MKLDNYTYRGARACVLLHEKYLREFVSIWKESKAKGLRLLNSKDPDYASMEAILRHVLESAGNYMIWICKMLELPDPEIDKAPDVENIEVQAEKYLEHLISQWEKPLVNVTIKECYRPEYASRWKTKYCIEAMLEHAINHPIRHTFQMKEMMVKC